MKDESQYVMDIERSNELACLATAKKNGHTEEQAMDCNDGEIDCPDCPFTKSAIRTAPSPR